MTLTSPLKTGYVLPILIMCGLLAACGGSPNSRHYLLQPITTAGPVSGNSDLVLIVGPIILPEHLNRNEIVSRQSTHVVTLAEFDRWAEPLSRNVTSVLIENLSIQLGTGKIQDYNVSPISAADYTVRIQVIEFGLAPDGAVHLTALASISNKSGQLLSLEKTRYQARATDASPESQVIAMSQVLGDLSEAIAREIQAAERS